MRITLDGASRTHLQECYEEMYEEILGVCPANVQVSETRDDSGSADGTQKGDVATITSILIAAVSAGGALTVAMGKDGFLSRLASVLEAYIRRSVDILLTDDRGRTIKLSGSAADIRKILEDIFQ